MKIREPVAGFWGFYPVDRDQLIRELEWCFDNTPYGPGRRPVLGEPQSQRWVVGGIVPHAGYRYSGPCAAWFYHALAESGYRFDTVIILGTNHTGYGGALTTTSLYDEWETPLGKVPVAVDVVEELKQGGVAMDEPRALKEEHSVEVQLPFLQYISDWEWQLVPLTAKPIDVSNARHLGKRLLEIIKEKSERPLFIVSSDFTHHGYIYGYVLFDKDIVENVASLDNMFIQRILELDLDGFFMLMRKYMATVCGWPAIMLLIHQAELEGWEPRLLKYYNSGHISGRDDIVVGYASIAFYSSPKLDEPQ
ncbi:MAG: AmmeMemoRadiSam system protein B [Desulfurococcales archaeon]|nr:AmmeMemoRadiSam system protein B [Desulfurococcales archaeon]